MKNNLKNILEFIQFILNLTGHQESSWIGYNNFWRSFNYMSNDKKGFFNTDL
ncbi:hypothetical protein [uncultured Ilyobacter sp.]|jgi:hypothetical protein|uniref:hypothetical protein n=1 Tax=uncultured Ilyobacter sp. TaxID=544433 RepID=UPI002AA6523E|nr:hypothetical protein [uncultured Ilyobacter sp.]